MMMLSNFPKMELQTKKNATRGKQSRGISEKREFCRKSQKKKNNIIIHINQFE